MNALRTTLYLNSVNITKASDNLRLSVTLLKVFSIYNYGIHVWDNTAKTVCITMV